MVGEKNGEAGWRLRHWYRILATEERFDVLYIVGLLLCELLLGCVIIERVPYTEIDWQAYMEEVDAYEAGERDYTKIRGGTGPLVYPAGFLYLFSALKAWTGQGTDVRRAQYIFLAFYVATQASVLAIYQQCLRRPHHQQRSVHEVWSWRLAMGVLCLSKRLHSIYLLRLFNDGPTMLLLYMALYLFNNNRWSIGCLFFSLAVSIKMNVLLFAPGLLLLLLQTSRSINEVILRLGLCCALPQLLLGAPFLLTYPISYLRKAFELDRVFFYKWTVNWKVRGIESILECVGVFVSACSSLFSSSSSLSSLSRAVSFRGKLHIETAVDIVIGPARGRLALPVCLPSLGHQSTARTATPSRLHDAHVVAIQFRRHLFRSNIALSVLRLVLSRPAISLVVHIIVILNNETDDDDSNTNPVGLFGGD
jgi:ALG3 protein